jgi:UDP-4-amino-4-deoxy-L-arabinose-oxoglutarate aminotransferase
MKVDFYRHALSSADGAAMTAVLDTPFLTSGAVGKAVEAQLRDFFAVPGALLVNSWTNGAVATLLALDIGPGDEVIVPAMTFIASANVVELLGARPIFVDVDPSTLLMRPEAVEAALTARTKAVMPVHLYGQMADMRGLQQVLAARPDVRVIEDAAHCFEGERDGYLPGQLSDAAVFSFYATKNITCGEGGAMVTRHPWLAELVTKTRLHGMSAGAADRYRANGYRPWDMERLGVKANLPDLLAALLPPQIDRIRLGRARRAEIAATYTQGCRQLGVRVPAVEPGVLHAWHIFPIHVGTQARDRVIAGLNELGIGVAVNYRSVPATSFYRDRYKFTASDFPVAYEWGEGTLTLPFYPNMTDEQVGYVIESLARVLGKTGSN